MHALTLGLLTTTGADSIDSLANATCSISDITRSFIANGDLSRFHSPLTYLQSGYTPYPADDSEFKFTSFIPFENKQDFPFQNQNVESEPLLTHGPQKKKTQKKSYRYETRCLPKSGTRHPDDEHFYHHSADTSDIFVRRLQDEGRCDVFLYLRSKDFESPELPPGVGAALIKSDRVRSRAIETVGDICKEMNTIHKNGGKVKGLLIQAHGNPDSLTLNRKPRQLSDLWRDHIFDNERPRFGGSAQPGEFEQAFIRSYEHWMEDSGFGQFYKKVSTTSTLKTTELTTKTIFPKKGCLNYLEPEAPIILLSCSTGGENPLGRKNLANAIAHQAIGHPVFAPKNEVFAYDLKISKQEGKWNVRFMIGEKDFSYEAYERAKSRKTLNKKK